MSFRRRWRNGAALTRPAAEQALCDAEFQSSLYRFRVIHDTFGQGDKSMYVRYASNSDQGGES